MTRRNLIATKAEDFRPPVFKPNTTARNRLENALRRYLDLQAGSIWRDLRAELATATGTLLDIGCGAQIYRPLVPAHVTYRGIDTKDAQVRFGYSVPDTHYFEGTDWGVAAGSIDTALCTEVLEHIDDPAAFLNRAAEILRPGGRLILTVPFAARWHFIPYDYWRYTPSGLQILLTQAGFSEIVIHARGNPVTVACYKAMSLCLLPLFGGPLKRAVGVALLPALAALALLANLTLTQDWGEDSLGYTVVATK